MAPTVTRLLVHGLTALITALLLLLASQTGGIHSHVLVWLCMLPVALILLRGPKAALVWIVINLVALFLLYLGTARGGFTTGQLQTVQSLPWALLNKLLALSGLVVVVLIYDRRYRERQQEIDRQNLQLRRIHQTLTQTQAYREEFLAAVSHELRTPMNAILGFNGVLCRELADQPEQLEMAGHIRRSTERLLRLVNDILDFSQLAAGRLDLHCTDFDLHALLHEALQAHTPQARQKGLAILLQKVEGLPQHVHADRLRLWQVLNHLLQNAVTFTDSGQVCLRASQRADRLRLEVQDTGCGIAPERQARIFSGQEAMDTPTPWAHQGTGLGLDLCQRLVQLQSGEIGVSSQPGQGSVFWFELPLVVPAPPPQARRPDDARAPGSALRILLVDDNKLNLMVASMQIGQIWPHAEIVQAQSGQEALDLVQQQRFDVALIDMLMPEMDGLQLATRIRELPDRHKAHLPIVALTANHQPAEQARCLAAGMDAVACKPIDAPALAHSVRSALQKERP